MKNVFTFFLLAGFSVSAFSQITSRTVSTQTTAAVMPYDSLKNIDLLNIKDDFRKYIGQEILVLEKKLSSNTRLTEHLQYLSFAKSPVRLSTSNTKDMYNPVKDGLITMCDPKAIEGKYFRILDVVKSGEPDRQTTFLKMQRRDNNDVVYYYVGYSGYAENISFLVVGYYEKLKELYVSKEYIYAKNYLPPTETTELNTNTPISVKYDSKWTCTDVTLMRFKNDITEVPVLVFKNSENQEIAVNPQKKHGTSTALNFTDFTLREDYDAAKQKEAELKAKKEEEERINAEIERKREEEQEKQRAIQAQKDKAQDQKNAAAAVAAKEKRKQDLLTKYGQTNGALIAAGQVKIGMTAAMCIDAWGKPSDINRTTNAYGTSEQWVYNHKSYLYFKDGILTSIQN